MDLLTTLASSVLYADIDVQSIPPSQIVAASKEVAQGAVNFGQGMAAPLAYIALVAAGIVLLVGVCLALAKITQKILLLGIGLFFGMVIMVIFLNHPQEIMGLIYGGIDSFFKHLSPSTSSTSLFPIHLFFG